MPGIGLADISADWMSIGWTGGACELHTTLVFAEADNGYRLLWRADPNWIWALGCPAVGIPRGVEIRFTELIEPHEIRVERR